MQVENNIITTDGAPLDDIYKGGVGYFCFELMKRHSPKIAELDARTGQEETYESLLKKSIRTSIILQNKGVQKGDTIVIYSKNQLYACVPLISCFFLGAIPTYLDDLLTSIEVVNVLKQLDPKLILTTSEKLETIQKFIKTEGNHVNTEILIFDQGFYEPQENEGEFQPIYVNDLKETVMIPFSSGTTGFPKGICISHYALLRRNYDGLCPADKTKVLFSYGSFHWLIQAARLLCSIRSGICRLIDPEPFEAKKVWYLLEKFKVNVVFLIPYAVMEMYNVGKPKNLDLMNLTTIIVPGCKLPKQYHQNVQELLPSVDVFLLYGQTEVGPLTAFSKCDLHREYNRKKLGSIGVPYSGSGNSYKVVDLNTGEALGPNKPGELHVKSDAVMSGYYNVDSSDQFDEDGWLKTGDEVLYDEDLCFFIIDRIKDMIIHKGWHIPPAFLEEELLNHPAVKRAAVIGIPHETDGEHPMALVVLKDNIKNVTSKDIEKFIAERMPERFHLKAGVKFIDDSYFAGARKVKRYLLKKLVLNGKI
ncbi:4-coumarate--CoA ligase 1 [Anoplophora glabripennis]|uniref:4-coumarate--CoA ligase 1 n=1 Tax=Anoplophora glabripennis TaxID=217634 RepID=UPI0008737104|nr:4-coumarate--CoA ligase 1 [Anoplophora glabripennis]XP_018573289.1 4-coumarate--CoA ligase 1 [Anoplophora glabripennis]